MGIRNPFAAMTLLALAGCHQAPPSKAAPSPTPTAAKPALRDYPAYLYRGVQVLPGTANVDWSRMSFGVSGNPPILTLFDSAAPSNIGPYGFPCWIRVAVQIRSDQPVPLQPGTLQPGATATLATPNPGVGGANPGPWTVLFDNNPPGHWSITKTAISSQPVSNAAASTMAGLTFQGLVANGTVTVLNGSYQNCAP